MTQNFSNGLKPPTRQLLYRDYNRDYRGFIVIYRGFVGDAVATQLYGDYFINHDIRIPFFPTSTMESRNVFFVAQVFVEEKFGYD